MCVYCFSVHCIIATPGRILDLMNKNLVKISKCGILVLDEVRLLLALKCWSIFLLLQDNVLSINIVVNFVLAVTFSSQIYIYSTKLVLWYTHFFSYFLHEYNCPFYDENFYPVLLLNCYDYYDILRVEYYCSVHNHENKKRKNYNY